MERSLLPEIESNGGLPEPPAGAPVRVIAAHHAACGESTRVRLPGVLAAAAIRRLRCAGCAQPFAVERIEVLGAERRLGPTLLNPGAWADALRGLRLDPGTWRLDPQGPVWRFASIPIAAVAVLGALLAIRGLDGEGPTAPAPSASAAAPPAAAAPPTAKPAAGPTKRERGGAGASKPSRRAELVRGSSYSLALPAGWRRVGAGAGASFAAAAAGGEAEATLWIERDPRLDFPTFISRSLRQLETLAGSARVIERVPAPTPEATVVRLAAASPAGGPSYEVTLRAAGPYRYYLATSVQPDADRRAVAGAELIAGSFTPEGKG